MAEQSDTASTAPSIAVADMHHTTQPVKRTSPMVSKRRKARQEEESIAGALRQFLVQHQLGISLNLILLLALTYVLFPALRARLSAFVRLSYPSSTHTAPGLYLQGPRDIYLVGSFVVLFTALRAFLLDYVFLPLAGLCGIRKAKQRVRFAEQAYVLGYYAFYWAWGVQLFVQGTPAGVTNVEGLLVSLWHDFPRVLLPASVKLYYLSQLAQWIQMVVVIHIEARRKDHLQMLAHHLITIALMAGSYGARQTRVGIAILVCMDLVDCIFPLAKILRYVGLQAACDVAFGAFVLTWILSRHVAYLAICWSIYAHLGVAGYGGAQQLGVFETATGRPVEAQETDGRVLAHVLQPLLDPAAATSEFNGNMKATFLGLLMALQAITLVWLTMIMRVVARVLSGQGAEDSRSDDEAEDDEEEEVEEETEEEATGTDIEKPRFIEVETDSVSAAGAWPAPRRGSSRKKSKGISSGLNLGEHKDFLNRIGCLSEEQLAREREKREASPRVAGPGHR